MTYNINDTGHVAVHNTIAAILPTKLDATTADAVVAGYVSTTGSSATQTAVAAFLGSRIPTDAADFNSLQAAADAAAADGKVFFASGIITTGQTLVIRSDADLTGLTINYTGSGVAVQLGSTTDVTFRLKVSLPKVIAMNKNIAGWSQVAGTVGVLAVNLNSCSQINVPYISNFETGLMVAGQGQGTAYNTFFIGHLANNKINHQVHADATGWSNQNTYIGGRYGHDSAEGSTVTGSRHIAMTAGLANPINNNTWTGASLEGNTPEFNVDFAGSANMLQNCRYETTGGARVRWQAGASDNQILYGYEARFIVQTHAAGSVRNQVHHSNGGTRPVGGALVLENTASSTAPVEYVMNAGATAAGSAPATTFSVSRTANATDMKRSADAFARMRFDHQNGRMYVGPGTADPTVYIGAIGTAFGVTGFGTTTVAPAAGAAGALPATPAGYLTLFIDGVSRKLPYY